MSKIGSILTTLACIAVVAFIVYWCCLRNKRKRGPNGEVLPSGGIMDNIRNNLPNNVFTTNRNINDEIRTGGGGGVQITELPQNPNPYQPNMTHGGGGHQYYPNQGHGGPPGGYPMQNYPPQMQMHGASMPMPMPMPVAHNQFQQSNCPYPPADPNFQNPTAPGQYENPPAYNVMYPK